MFLLGLVMAYGQTEKNGTIFSEHPALALVKAMNAAWVSGDTAAVAGYLHEEFRGWNGSNTNKNAQGTTKSGFIRSMTNFWSNFSHLSMEPSRGSTPDALEFKDGNIWVQTWNRLKGVHNATGVKVDMPVHHLYLIKDDKILTAIIYDNNNVFRSIWESMDDRKNGTIYNAHEYINKVRRMVHAFEFGDLETAYSFFADNARFTSLETPRGESLNLEEVKQRNAQMMEEYEINSIDVVGYPDYLEYDLRDSKAVQSWWDFRLTRKSDNKRIVMPVMYIHDFNDEGKIVRSSAYMSTKWLD